MKHDIKETQARLLASLEGMAPEAFDGEDFLFTGTDVTKILARWTKDELDSVGGSDYDRMYSVSLILCIAADTAVAMLRDNTKQ